MIYLIIYVRKYYVYINIFLRFEILPFTKTILFSFYYLFSVNLTLAIKIYN